MDKEIRTEIEECSFIEAWPSQDGDEIFINLYEEGPTDPHGWEHVGMTVAQDGKIQSDEVPLSAEEAVEIIRLKLAKTAEITKLLQMALEYIQGGHS